MSTLPKAFIAWWQITITETGSVNAAHRRLRCDWFGGYHIPGYTQDASSKNGLPRGWSLRNLARLAPTQEIRKGRP